jgi:PAS domain S-box-containing protein
MELLKDTPIRLKLLWVTLATCGLALIITCGALFWFQTYHFRKGFVAELESLGAIVAQHSSAPLSFADPMAASEVLSALKVRPSITAAVIFDREGQVFAAFGDEMKPDEAPRPEPLGQPALEAGYAHLGLPITQEGATLGRLQLRARYADEFRTLQSLYGMVLAAALAGSTVLICCFASRLQRIVTVPIAALAAAARNVSEQEDYETRVPAAGNDEVGVLTRTFNQMLDQIQSREQRLRESQLRYEVAVEGSSDGLWDWDLTTNAVYFSPRWKGMLGYRDDELPNSFDRFRSLVHPADVAGLLARMDTYLQGDEETFEAEFRALAKDGSLRWILSRGAALRNAEGEPVRFAGSHTDITERKLAEDEIRLARAQFEALVNSIHGIVWEADPVDFHLLFISDQAEAMLGFPIADWLADPQFWQKRIHPDDRGPTLEAFSRGVTAGHPFQLEYRMTTADEKVITFRASLSVERAKGRPGRVRGVALDITQQKLAAEQIARMQQELVETSRLAGMAEVATGVLHNVGNVLNSVNVSTTLFMEQLAKSKTASLAKAVQMLEEHKDDLAEFLTRDPKGRQLPAFLSATSQFLAREQALLTREAQALQENVDHIKQIVAMQQGFAKVCGAMESLDLHALVEDAVRLSSSALARHQIELVRQFEPAPPVLIDRHKVLQILVNLISNAKHALDGRAGGRRLILQITHPAPDRVRVDVIDNGVGIAPENLTRIFQHGFTTKKNGHGFGLHSGANAARELGGALHAFSQGPGTGATLSLDLPVAKPEGRPSNTAFKIGPREFAYAPF